MKSFDQTLGVEVELEIIKGNQARQSRQLIFKEASGTVHHLPIPDDLRDPARLRAAFDKLGTREVIEGRVIYDPEESSWVEPLIKAVWPDVTFSEGELAATSYTQGATIDIELTDRYFRAIAKMGFHYFLTQFPQYSGAEPLFSEIRRFIFEPSPVSEANKFIGERQHPLLANLAGGGRPDGWQAHILAAEITTESFLAHVQLFLCEDFRPRTYTVILAPNAIGAAPVSFGHFYEYFEGGPKGKYAGEAYHLDAVPSPFPPLPLKPVVGEPT
jgi:hypothetical protein